MILRNLKYFLDNNQVKKVKYKNDDFKTLYKST